MSFLSDLPSPKVIGAALGGTGGLTVSGFLVWLIGAGLYGVGFGADVANDAVRAVPLQVSAMLALLLTFVGITVPGYQITDPARNANNVVPASSVSDEGSTDDNSFPVEQADVEELLSEEDEAQDVSVTEELVPSQEPVSNEPTAPLDSRPIYTDGR